MTNASDEVLGHLGSTELFVEEPDSTLFTALIEEAGPIIHTSKLSRLELLRAFWGKRLEGAIARVPKHPKCAVSRVKWK